MILHLGPENECELLSLPHLLSELEHPNTGGARDGSFGRSDGNLQDYVGQGGMRRELLHLG